MSQGPLCPNLSQKVQKEKSQMANRNLPRAMLLGGSSVNLNHLKKNPIKFTKQQPNIFVRPRSQDNTLGGQFGPNLTTSRT